MFCHANISHSVIGLFEALIDHPFLDPDPTCVYNIHVSVRFPIKQRNALKILNPLLYTILRYTIFKSTTPNQHISMCGNASEKEATKNEILKCDSLCIIAKLEKGSYSDRRLPDVYKENMSGNSSTTVRFMKKVSGRSR